MLESAVNPVKYRLDGNIGGWYDKNIKTFRGVEKCSVQVAENS